MISFFVATGSRWRRSGTVRFHTPSLPQKLARAFSRPGVEATPILATEITWWHGNGDCGYSNIKLLLMSRILVVVKKMVLSRRRAITRAATSWSPGAARQHPREFDTNNTHTTMFDPLNPGVLCNTGYPSDTHLKFRETSFAHNLFISNPIVLKFCTEHDSDAVVLCAKFVSD